MKAYTTSMNINLSDTSYEIERRSIERSTYSLFTNENVRDFFRLWTYQCKQECIGVTLEHLNFNYGGVIFRRLYEAISTNNLIKLLPYINIIIV